jgi:phosphoglycerate-specific signal transduction histidine kinase
VTTRLIARPLAEMTRAVLEVRKGNYEIAIAHDSGDAAGALAEALEGMLGEVKTRTDEMERSNERLLREIGDRRQAEAQLQQAYDELRAASRVAAMAKGMQSGERMSDADFEEMASVLKMTRSATNARQCGLRILAEARRAREAEAMLTG